LPSATIARLDHTGHLGLVTRPHAFAALVAEFADRHAAAAAVRRPA
jgi:hypothetical protein